MAATELNCTELLLYTLRLRLFWRAPLGVHSAIRRHQPPQRAVLSLAECFIQCDVASSQIVLNGVIRGHPGGLFQLSGGGAVRIILASASSSMRAICPKYRKTPWLDYRCLIIWILNCQFSSDQSQWWLIDWLSCGFTGYMSHSTQNKSFWRRSPSQSLGWYGKTKPNTTKAHIHRSKRNVLQHQINTKKLKPGLVTSYKIRPGNRESLFWFWHFINLSLTYLHRHYPLTYSPESHTGLPVIRKGLKVSCQWYKWNLEMIKHCW